MADENDDLRSQLEQAFAGEAPAMPETPAADMGQNEPDPFSPEAPDNADPAPVETPEQKDQRARDEQGRFVAKPAEPKQPEQQAKAPEAPEKPVQAQPAERIAPPMDWTGNAKVRWEKLPRDVQQAISTDYQNIEKMKAGFAGIARIVGPRAQTLTQQFGSPEAAIGQLFQLSDFAAQNPVGFVQHFCRVRGIDLSQIGGQQQAGQQADQPHPVVASLMNEINGLKTRLQTYEGQQSQAEMSALQTQIMEFASSPDAPYFNEVRKDMAPFVEAGMTLRDAYDRAVWANPTTRASLLQAQQEKAEAERRAKVEAARRASGANLTGSPPHGMTGNEPPDSVRGALEAAIAQHGGRI